VKYKQKYLKNLKEQQILKENSSNKTQSSIVDRKETTTPDCSERGEMKKFNDWDHVDQNGNFFTLEKDRLVSDLIVYLENDEVTDSIEMTDDITEINNKKVETNKDIRRSNSDDVFLSEDDEKEGDTESVQRIKKKSPPSSSSSSTSSKTVHIDLTEMIDEKNEISNSKSLSHLKKPSLIQSFFNLYDNLPKENLIYISKNQFTIVPISFITYCNNKRQLQLKRLKLAKTNQSKVLWLCLTLDLEC
jgi:hypothetical protein